MTKRGQAETIVHAWACHGYQGSWWTCDASSSGWQGSRCGSSRARRWASTSDLLASGQHIFGTLFGMLLARGLVTARRAREWVLLGERSRTRGGPPAAWREAHRTRRSPVVKAQRSPWPRPGRVLRSRERAGEARRRAGPRRNPERGSRAAYATSARHAPRGTTVRQRGGEGASGEAARRRGSNEAASEARGEGTARGERGEAKGARRGSEVARGRRERGDGYAAIDSRSTTAGLRRRASSAGTSTSAVATQAISPISDARPKPRIARFSLMSSEP